jgi:probable HAF family extracellular repeat protein
MSLRHRMAEGGHQVTTAGHVSIRLMQAAAALIFCIGCGDRPTEVSPEAAALAVAALEVVSGDDQFTAAGGETPVVPTVRALDSRGRPVPGAPVVFAAVAGGGEVAGGRQVTDATGRASAGSWKLGMTAGANLLEARVEGRDIRVKFRAVGRSDARSAPPVTVGAAGGAITPDLQGSGVNGLTITIPPGAYAAATSFTVSVYPAPALTGLAANEIMALVGIDNGGAASDSLILVTVPLSLAPGRTAAAFWYDGSASNLDPVEVIDVSNGAITVGLQAFPPSTGGVSASGGTAGLASIQGLLFKSADPDKLFAAATLPTGFRPGHDDWEFINLGSSLAPGGHCTGQVLSMLWYFRSPLRQQGNIRRFAPVPAIHLPALYANLGLKPEEERFDNQPGYRVASLLQEDARFVLGVGSLDKELVRFALRQDAGRNALDLLEALSVTKLPQLVIVLRADETTQSGRSGHVLLVHHAEPSAGKVYVSDPNRPGRSVAIPISLQNGLGSFQGAAAAGQAEAEFPLVRYVPHSNIKSFMDDRVAGRWAEFERAGASGRLDSPHFPSYSLLIDGKPYAEGMVIHGDSVQVDTPTGLLFAWDRSGQQVNPYGAYDATTRTQVVPVFANGNSATANRITIQVGDPWMDFRHLDLVRGPYRVARALPFAAVLDELRVEGNRWYDFKIAGADGNRARYIDYKSVDVPASSVSNSRVRVRIEHHVRGALGDMTPTGGYFSLRLETDETEDQTTEFDVTYGGVTVQRIVAIVTARSMIDLGTLGGSRSWAAGINNHGHVVGTADDPTTNLAFLWTPEGGMRSLGTVAAGGSGASAINDHGHVVGSSTTTANGQWGAFLWTPEGGMRGLGSLWGGSGGARGINNHGIVVGWARNSDGWERAFLWSPGGGMQDLGTLGVRSWANGINDRGHVVGQYDNADAWWGGAFLWTPGEGMRDLGTLGGEGSLAVGINNDGHVVGWSRNAAGQTRAYLWTPEAGMRDLGTLGGSWSNAHGINNHGHVVGSSQTASGQTLAFLWTPEGGMRSLGSLAGGSSVAFDINDQGEVIGQSLNTAGVVRAFLWNRRD